MAGYGIGGGGQLGFAVEQLSPPVQAALATAASGGTILAGTYRYVVTAINANGETTISNEQTIVTTGSTSTVTVTWSAVTGATGYKLYKTAAGGATLTELLYKTVGVVVSDIDTTPGSPAGAFPTTNTATSPGVYAAPTKFCPINSESLKFQQATVWRRPIRKSVSIVGAVPGNVDIEGDIEMEALEDVVIQFLRAARCAIVKTGTGPNWIYTCTPGQGAIPSKTLSITVERAGEIFGYTGCVVSGFKFGINDGMLTFSVSIRGRDEATAAVPTPTWPTSTPFGAGMFSIEFPTATPVFDTDTFEFSIEDNGESQFRLKSGSRGAQFIKYGERTMQLTCERDFTARTDYDNFKAYVAQSITLLATKGVNNQISLLVPVGVKDTYETNLSGQGDLVRGSIQYYGVIDGSGNDYQIVVKTQEDFVP